MDLKSIEQMAHELAAAISEHVSAQPAPDLTNIEPAPPAVEDTPNADTVAAPEQSENASPDETPDTAPDVAQSAPVSGPRVATLLDGESGAALAQRTMGDAGRWPDILARSGYPRDYAGTFLTGSEFYLPDE